MSDNANTQEDRREANGAFLPRWGLVSLALLLFTTSAVYLLLKIPVGIPGEWWLDYRRSFPSAAAIVSLAFVAAVFLAVAHLFDLVEERRSGSASVRGLLAMTVLYMALLFTATACGPGGRTEFAAPSFKFDACGLYGKEAASIAEASQYLRDFPRIAEDYASDYANTVSVNNNPPGATMVFYAARCIAEKHPALSDMAVKMVFGSDFTAPNTVYSANVLGSWLLLAGAALSFVPAYLVARRFSRKRTFLITALAMLSGSIILFNPSKDTLQVFFFLWMFYFFLLGSVSRPVLFGTAMGLVAALAFFFTLATIVVVILLVVYAAAHRFTVDAFSPRSAFKFFLASAAGLLAGILALYLISGYDTFSSLLACYRNHALFYEHFPRTYWKWTLFDLWEFAMSTGAALFAAAVWGVFRHRHDVTFTVERPSHERLYIAATFALLLALDISGKNSSEVARLWLFFMPFLAIPALALVARGTRAASNLAILSVIQAAHVVLLRIFLDVWRNQEFFAQIEKYAGR